MGRTAYCGDGSTTFSHVVPEEKAIRSQTASGVIPTTQGSVPWRRSQYYRYLPAIVTNLIGTGLAVVLRRVASSEVDAREGGRDGNDSFS
jgi:hypothetical protein